MLAPSLDGSGWTRLLAAALVAAAIACSDSGTGPEDDAEIVLEGRVVAVDGSPAEGADVVARWGDLEARADVQGDGGFRLALDSLPTEPGFVGVRPPEAMGATPALVRVSEEPADADLRIVLLPSRWTVRRGVHAGTDVPIHPSEAARGRVLPSYWGFTFPFQQEGSVQTVVDSTRWTAGLKSWRPDVFPVFVAIDRDGSTDPVTSTDSVRLWAALDRFEEVLGRNFFRPARAEDLPPPEPDLAGGVPGAVLLRVDSTLSVRGRAVPSLSPSIWFLSEEVGSWSGSRVTGLSAVSADAEAGEITFRSPAGLDDPALVMHEAMHILGVGHGCEWRSVQTFCESLAAAEPTAEDVAYLEVLEAAREREKAMDTRQGILAAVLGERALSLGLSPIPDVSLVSLDGG